MNNILENKSANNFIKKYNQRQLQDSLSYVSKEYNAFQNFFKRAIKSVCINIDAELIQFNKGHYFESFFIKKNNKVVYVSHEELNRTLIDWDNRPVLIRTAKDEKDYRGGANQYCLLYDLPRMIDELTK